MILTNKNMNQQQKGIASAVGVVALVIAAIAGVSFNPPSVEQYTADTAEVMGYTGRDLVFWTKAGSVYHLCDAASDLQLESKDNKIYSGTVGDAHAAGKSRLTLKVEQELKQCGISTPVVPSPTPQTVTKPPPAWRHGGGVVSLQGVSSVGIRTGYGHSETEGDTRWRASRIRWPR